MAMGDFEPVGKISELDLNEAERTLVLGGYAKDALNFWRHRINLSVSIVSIAIATAAPIRPIRWGLSGHRADLGMPIYFGVGSAVMPWLVAGKQGEDALRIIKAYRNSARTDPWEIWHIPCSNRSMLMGQVLVKCTVLTDVATAANGRMAVSHGYSMVNRDGGWKPCSLVRRKPRRLEAHSRIN